MSLLVTGRRFFRGMRNGMVQVAAIGSGLIGPRLAHRAVMLQISLYLSMMLGLYALPIPATGSEGLATLLTGLQTGVTSTLLLAGLSSVFAPDRPIPFIGKLNSFIRPEGTNVVFYYEVLIMLVGPLLAIVEGPLVIWRCFQTRVFMERNMRSRSNGGEDNGWKTIILLSSLAGYIVFGLGVNSLAMELGTPFLWCSLGTAAVMTVLALVNPDGSLLDSGLALGYFGIILNLLNFEISQGREIAEGEERLFAILQIGYLASTTIFSLLTLNFFGAMIPVAIRHILLCMSTTFRLLIALNTIGDGYYPLIFRSVQIGASLLLYVWFMFFGEDHYIAAP